MEEEKQEKPIEEKAMAKEPKKERSEAKEKQDNFEGDVSQIAEKMKEKLANALKKKAHACTVIKKDEKGQWNVTIEILEEEHMPSKFDLLGIYDAVFDKSLNLKEWQRKGQRMKG